MNEKIREMAKEATRLSEHPHRSGSGICLTDDLLKNFSELLINECALAIQDFVDHRFPASEYPKRLKRHFGVSPY